MTDDRQAEVERKRGGGQNIALHIAEKGRSRAQTCWMLWCLAPFTHDVSGEGERGLGQFLTKGRKVAWNEPVPRRR